MENLLFSLVSMEIMLLSISLNFIYFSVFLHDPKGQIIALLILGIAASEAAVGLSLLLVASRLKNTIKTVAFNTLKG
jgi:NADH-quinone oxidoreductase subunit K